MLDFKLITAFMLLNRDDRSKIIFGTPLIFSQKSLFRLRLYYAVTSGPDTKCRDNLPFRRRFASYGGTSKRGGFLEEPT